MNIFTVTDSKKLTCIIVRFRHPRASWTPISQDNPDFQHVRACRVSIHQSKPFSNKSWPFPEVIYILVPNSDLARRFPENTPPTFASSNANPHLCRLNHRHLKSWGFLGGEKWDAR